MLYALSTKHKKHIAAVFFLIFYSDILYAGFAKMQNGAIVHLKSNYEYQIAASVVAMQRNISQHPELLNNGRNIQNKTNAGMENVNSPVEAIVVQSGNEIEEDASDPGQPEMQTFKPVGADNMVDLFTGDLSYNIPLLDVGGYPVNIFYNSGVSMEQEASWVGLGWNLNPGTIARNVRGIPDDFDGTEKVVKEMSIKDDITIGASVSLSNEFVGYPLRINAKAGIFYNSYRGLGLDLGVTPILNLSNKNKTEKTAKGVDSVTLFQSASSLSASLSVNSQQGASISPSFSINMFDAEKNAKGGLSASASFNSRVGLQTIQVNGELKKSLKMQSDISFGYPSVTPSIRMPISRTNINVGVSLGSVNWFNYASTAISGYYSSSGIAAKDKRQEKAAYGYLYMNKTGADDNALMDYNRINDGVYTKNTPVISMPVYTYDVFSISGEGTGGTFRAYRGDIGYVKDHYVKTNDIALSPNIQLGSGNLVATGVNLDFVYTPTVVQEWKEGNLARNVVKFRENEKDLQAVYFRNPAEKTIGNEAYNKAIGNDDLVRFKLSNLGSAYPNLLPSLDGFSDNKLVSATYPLTPANSFKTERAKRSQVISYLNAKEASEIGLDKKIVSYPMNLYPVGACADNPSLEKIERTKEYRRSNHISEIDVLNPDGRRYIYGLPVYNISQQEVSFNTSGGDEIGQMANYDPAIDPTTENKNGKDNFYQRDIVPAYAHSFLLTGLLSPDYVDVKGDGITEDDMGDGVKFNYTQLKNPENPASPTAFNWRTPFTNNSTIANQALYSQGLRTDKQDDKANYTFGQKEMWYLHSIESKTMIATFFVNERNDAKAARDEHGGISISGSKLLDHIDLYAKADLIKANSLGKVAKPIKTVHFEYTYDLCKNVKTNTGTIAGSIGKLTLKSVWFSYNGNNKVVKNKYIFKYDNGGTYDNPDFDHRANDRWGNYKPNDKNPGTMNNADYPYTPTKKENADAYAQAWTLKQISLPSGGNIKISYESDDYGYVQNKRACRMFEILGFGDAINDVPSPVLYKDKDLDKMFVFVKPDVSIANEKELRERYFEGLDQLYLKLWVKMPSDINGSGYESIASYAEIESFGLVPGNDRIFIKVKPLADKISPMANTAIQFLSEQLPSKFYPGFDTRRYSGPMAVLKALNGIGQGVLGTFSQPGGRARRNYMAREVDISRSLIRLNDPDFKRMGGGLRVKKVEISDEFDQMTLSKDVYGNVIPGSGMAKSVYGQEYDYTTTATINGQPAVISSGVASYEPIVGSEENPFRKILRYTDKQPMGPTQHGAIETPLGEIFYPSASVGYSKVSVKSINRSNVKSGVGTQVTTFYTSKDFPTISDFTDFDEKSRKRFRSNPILKMLKLDVREAITLSQGFRVQLNDMNGKLRTQASYAENSTAPISYTENFYRLSKVSENTFKLNNEVSTVSAPDGLIINRQIGKDVELMADFREHRSQTVTVNADINALLSTFGVYPVPAFSIIPPVYFEENSYRAASLVKVVNTYGILDSVISIDKGSLVSTRDLVYDGQTGDVLLTKTNNEFKDPIYNFSYPAYWAYSGMQPACRNIDVQYNGVQFRYGKIVDLSKVNINLFESGDELYVNSHGETNLVDNSDCSIVNGPSTLRKSFEKKIWALDVTKDSRNTEKEFIFIDRNGELYNADKVSLRIVRSGKRNLLSSTAGSVSMLNNPIVTAGTTRQIIVNNDVRVINTAAGTFKDNWRAEDAFYLKDNLVRTAAPVDVYSQFLFLDATYYYGSKKYFGSATRKITQQSNTDFFEAKRQSFGNGSNSRSQFVSWAKINLDPILAGGDVYVISARLDLASHNSDHNNSQEDPTAIHGRNNPHSVPNSSAIGIIRRMKTPWYTENDPGWSAGLFDSNEKIIDANNGVDKSTQAIISVGKTEIGDPQKRFSADITNMVRAMVKDKKDGLNYATGFRLHIQRQDDVMSLDRLGFTRYGNKFMGKPTTQTLVELKYARCVQPGSTIVYNPATAQYECISYTNTKQCMSVFTKSFVNPYVHGILGNWRADKAYTFYGDRVETDPTVSVDIRKGGVIKQFVPFWTMQAPGLQPATANTKWVWNSEITQFNKRGLEIENRDPLGRYNSGLYGYERSLPVAVANNARYREIAFDGFEDYGYKPADCNDFCRPLKHLNIPNVTTMLSEEEAHTGKTSLKVLSGQAATITAPVVINSLTDPVFGLDINIAATYKDFLTVEGKGKGLTADYYNAPSPTSNFAKRTIDPQINWLYRNWTYGTPIPEIITDKFSTVWTGYIQAPEAGNYLFSTNGDDAISVLVNGKTVINFNKGRGSGIAATATESIPLTKGQDVYIEVKYSNTGGQYTAQLFWKTATMPRQLVPTQFLYPIDQRNLVNGSIVTKRYWCKIPQRIQANGSSLIDGFSLIREKKMVFSTWVKQASCTNCATYPNAKAYVYYNGATSPTETFTVTGPVIEGWQRIEQVFTIPSNATTVTVQLKAENGNTVFFDDVRFHPYNANMKSFVYHPSNLRLMAEMDENNYASFYEYDDDGTLVRVKKETIKGIKTIKETRSALQTPKN